MSKRKRNLEVHPALLFREARLQRFRVKKRRAYALQLHLKELLQQQQEFLQERRNPPSGQKGGQ